MSDGDVVANFIAINGCTEEEAVEYLANANFDLALAHSLYVADHTNRAVQEIGASSTSEMSNPGSPGYTTPPYLVGRLDGGGGGRHDNFPSVPHGRYGPSGLSRQQSAPLSIPEMDTSSLLFTTPPFVYQGTLSLQQFCTRAVDSDQWVLLSLLGDDFNSFCVNRDIWRFEGLRETLSMFSIYQVTAASEHSGQLLHGYRIDPERDMPCLLLLNPLTTMKESRIPLNYGPAGIDAGEVNEALLAFLAERGSPSQWEAGKCRRHASPTPPIPPASTTIQSVVVEDYDNENSLPTASHPEGVTPPPPVVAVDISPYEAMPDEKNAFALRCRLPKGNATLRLKPETPAQLLVEYLAYRAYHDNPEAYPQGVPKCSLKTGYPPRELSVENPNVQLVTWGGVRSGDTVFLHIQ